MHCSLITNPAERDKVGSSCGILAIADPFLQGRTADFIAHLCLFFPLIHVAELSLRFLPFKTFSHHSIVYPVPWLQQKQAAFLLAGLCAPLPLEGIFICLPAVVTDVCQWPSLVNASCIWALATPCFLTLPVDYILAFSPPAVLSVPSNYGFISSVSVYTKIISKSLLLSRDPSSLYLFFLPCHIYSLTSVQGIEILHIFGWTALK